jgi:serine/threonine protein phosphatase PrpC
VKRFIESIFGSRKFPAGDIPTRPVSYREESGLERLKISLEPSQFIVGCAQSTGRQREHNEDALLTFTATLASNGGSMPFGLFVVADGMGGHQHGERASMIAVRTMGSYILRKLYTPLLSLKPSHPDESLLEIMQEGVQEAHRIILKQAPGGGTTLTAALVVGNQMTIAHVGDSRAYLIYGPERIEALTRDHSLVKRLVELGQITTAEAAVHPQRNVLYRALGQGEPFDPDIYSMQVFEAAYLLLCSDGLWGVVAESEIQRLVLQAHCVEDACQRLVDAANEAGGPDNISVILARLPG